MIEIRHLTKRYQIDAAPILDDVSLSFPETGLYYLIGKSGAGKTTLLSLLGCIDEEYEGSILFHKKELKELTAEEKSFYRFSNASFVFQDFCSMEEESVEDNLHKVLDIISFSDEEKEKRIQDVLKRVGLEEKRKMKFKDASGGEKKRLSLARGLIKPSEILLVDEPVSSLDKKLRKSISSILEEEAKNRLILVITHELESIPSSATIYEIRNGKIEEKRKRERKEAKAVKEKIKRHSYPFKAKLRSSFSFLKANIRFMSVVFFALTLSLFSSSFSFQLSGNVSSSLVESFSKYMKDNTVVIENKEQGIERSNYEIASEEEVNHYVLNYPDSVIDKDIFYLTSLNEIFQGNQSLKARYQNSTYSLKKLSADSILNYSLPEEEGIESLKDYKSEEIALQLDEESYLGFYYLLTGTKKNEITEKEVSTINGILSYRIVSLDLLLNVSDWNYHLEHSFRIRNAFLSDTCKVIVPERGFSSYFVKEILHFKERFEEEKGEYPPWTLLKCRGIRAKKGKLLDFFISFLKDEQSYLTLEILKLSGYYRKGNSETYNRIGIYKDYKSRLSVKEITRLYQENADIFSSLCFSSFMYTYTASGYISGFLNPYFFSRYREKLNRIQDKNAYSIYDLGNFQGSVIETEDGVIKADLVSSMDGNGLAFQPYDDALLLYGEKPKSYGEIGISKKMAEEFYPRASDALGEKLYVLTLEKTQKEGGQYRHFFSEGELTVSAIYDSEEIALYQDALFPLAYSFYLTQPNKDSFTLTNATMQVDFDKVTKEECEALIEKGGKYTTSFPMYDMIAEINHTLNLLSELFFVLSLLSFLCSGYLMFLSFFLILKKDRKGVGVMLALGYQKKEIFRYYLFLILALSFFSYLSSLSVSLFTERMIQNTMELTLSTYQGSIAPYLISFMEMIILSLIVFLLLVIQMWKISPKEALKSSAL